VAEPGQDKSPESIGHRIVKAMLVIFFFQLFWKFGGLVVTLLVGSVFGSGPESDAYFFVTETVVFLLQTLCLKVFIPLVVPIFKQELSERGEEAAWRFGNTVLNLAAVLLAAAVVGGFIFAPRILSLFAMGFNEQQLALSARLMRWMLPGVFGICLATVTYAILNSYNVFGYAAAGDGVQKIVWAAALFVVSFAGLALPRMLDALAVGFVVSAGAMVLTHVLGLRSKLRFYRPSLPGLSLRRIGIEVAILAAHLAALGAGLWVCGRLRPHLPNEGSLLALQQVVLVVVVAAYLLLLWWRAKGRKTPMAKFAALGVPLMFGILFAKYRDIVTNLFASFTGTGVFSDLKYARKVGEAPNTLVIAALSIALLPHLSELAAAKLWADFANVMTKTIRVIIAFFVPLTALMIVLRGPIIALLFDRGNWTDYHLSHAGDALGLYILALPFFAIENPIQQSFFAMQRMWAPTIIGFLGTGFHILFLFIGIEWLGYGYFIVVAVVYGAARAFKNIILIAVMRMRVRILPWRPTVIFLAKAAIATAGVWAAAEFTYRPLKKLLPLDPYRRREVMIDTFNVELRDWEADNVDDFQIVSLSDPSVAEAFPWLARPAGTPLPSHREGQKAIMAEYRRSPRRSAGLRRDLGDLDLTKAPVLRAAVGVTEATDLTVELVTSQGTSYASKPVGFLPGGVQRVWVNSEDFCSRKALGDVVAVWLRDTTAVQHVQRKPTALLIGSFQVCDVEDAEGIGERLDAGPGDWRYFQKGVRGSGVPAQVADTGERPGEPEMALHLPASEKRRTIAGGRIEFFRLGACDRLTFKARADKTCRVEVNLLAPDPKSTDPADWVQMTTPVEIKASERRKAYPVPLSAFTVPGDRQFRKGEFAAIEFVVPDGVDFWLDNVAFVREAKGPRLGRVALFYELGKLIHVAVPTLAAFVVFVVLLFVLRVEEAREGWEWVKEKGLKKVIGKFRRKRA